MPDHTMPELCILIGLPGSGKSYYAEQMLKTNPEQFVIHSSDAIRKELYGDEQIQGDAKEIFSLMQQRTLRNLQAGKSVLYDATNISRKARRSILNQIAFPCTKTAIVFARPYSECQKFNLQRARNVPEDVIERMYLQWETPVFGEGFQQIQLYYPEEKYIGWFGSPKQEIALYQDYAQENPHHFETLGEHIRRTVNFIAKQSPENESLIQAAYLHDCGKPYTKQYDENGVAHYPQHANVGAYNSLFYHCKDALRVSQLVNYHMMFFQKDLNLSKLRKTLGEDLCKDLFVLHQADEQACVRNISMQKEKSDVERNVVL